jgi:hypothetical protein
MFVVAFAQIEPEDTSKADIETKAEYIITMTWERDDANDIDIWIQDPAGNLISFKQKSKGLTHIDRDDLGHANDFFFTPNGEKIFYDYNQEIVTIRGIIPGEWIINIHMFNQNQKVKPSTVSIKIDKLNPKVTTVFEEKIKLTDYWQEETVVRLIMGVNGDIISTNKIPISLIQKNADMARRTNLGHPAGRNAYPAVR